jgi:hypothetical protein
VEFANCRLSERMRGLLWDKVEHWRARAKETRQLAEQEDNPRCKKLILQIADDYNRLAQRAQLRIEICRLGTRSHTE